MKQNTMFPSLISDEELQPLITLVSYEDTARKLTVKTLIQYLGTAAELVDVNYSTLSKN